MTTLPATATSASLSPLYVDLDGSVLATDSLHEAIVGLLVRKPWVALALPAWVARGKAHFKTRVATAERLDPAALPYRDSILAHLRAERARGRRVVLATGAPRPVAEAIANHLALFDGVLATEGDVNLTGAAKLAAIEADAGGPFQYLGNGVVDLPIWERAERVLTADLAPRIAHRLASGSTPVHEVEPRSTRRLRAFIRAIRVHQWAKNLLVFVPILTAHLITQRSALLAGITAFAAFSFLASAIYLINDLADLRHDRAHPTKRHRPLASGAVSILAATALIPALLLAGFLLASTLPSGFQQFVAGYLVLTTAYSFWLKRVVALDTVVLASLYTLRVAAGAAAVMVTVSPWLFVFSVFLFLSLALVKRASELIGMQDRGIGLARGRGYQASDLDAVASLGAASGYSAVVVIALYVNGSPEARTLYQDPGVLYAICPLLLYWLTRIWILARRGEVTDDPVIFAMKDRVSYLVLAAMGVVTFLAT
jgi:4-hydroxybenzoate polyprenyltransferase